MSANFKVATDDIVEIFRVAWLTTGFIALYENIAGSIPTTNIPWARLSIRHAIGNLSSLSSPTGLQRYERQGTIIAQIFIPAGENLSEGYSLAKIVADAYEGAASPNGVWFRDVIVNEIGPDGDWFQLNVSIAFIYSEVK